MPQQLSEIDFHSIFFQPIRFIKDTSSDSMRKIFQIEAIIIELIKTHEKFTLITMKSILKFIGADPRLFSTKKSKRSEDIYWDNKYIGSIDLRYFKREVFFPYVIAKALAEKIILFHQITNQVISMSTNDTILSYNYWNELNPDIKKLVNQFISKYVSILGLTSQEKTTGIDFSCDPPRLFDDEIKKTYDDFEVERLYYINPR